MTPREPRTYYVYILASRSRTLYTGVTNNLARRMAEHRERLLPGFASRYRIHRLVYYEAYRDVRQAIFRETQIKKWRREKKVALIDASNPTWDDLSSRWFERAGKSSSRARADSSLRSE